MAATSSTVAKLTATSGQFNELALQRANEDMALAERKLHQMKQAKDVHELDSLWSEFLSSLQRVFNRLGNACQGGPSFAWYGRIKHERGSDDLLRYTHHARHADEHGIDKVTKVHDATIALVSTGSTHIRSIAMIGGKLFIDQTGTPATVTFNPARVELQSVVNRGVTYHPPREHLGVALSTAPTCLSVAEAALAYFKSKCLEAESKFSTPRASG